jgi:hypothetical protein
MLLQPGQQFTIVRQLGQPGDATTYYVKAIVRNSTTGNIVSTVNLTDRTNQRFTGILQVPQDPLGFGYYLDITTYVYTDAGYSTLSDLYTVENVPYLVFDRLTLGKNTSGGGDWTDYEKINKMIKKAISEIAFPEIKIPEQKEADLTSIVSSLEEISVKINGDVENSITPIAKKLTELQKNVEKSIFGLKEIINSRKEFTETDITPILSKLIEVKEDIVSNVQKHDKHEITKKTVENTAKEIIDTLEEKIQGIQEYYAPANEFIDKVKNTKVQKENKEDFVKSKYLARAGKLIEN